MLSRRKRKISKVRKVLLEILGIDEEQLPEKKKFIEKWLKVFSARAYHNNENGMNYKFPCCLAPGKFFNVAEVISIFKANRESLKIPSRFKK